MCIRDRIAIFLVGAFVGAFWVPRIFPKAYLRWMMPLLPAFNLTTVLPGGMDSINGTILNDVWGALAFVVGMGLDLLACLLA